MNQEYSEKHPTRMKKGAISLFIWTFAWLFSTASLAFGPKLLWDFNAYVSLLVVVINLGLGVKVILVNKQHLQDMDEMQRKIHFNAMAISLGATLLAGTVMGLLEPAGLTAQTPHISNVLFVLGISYIVAVVVNYRKYL